MYGILIKIKVAFTGAFYAVSCCVTGKRKQARILPKMRQCERYVRKIASWIDTHIHEPIFLKKNPGLFCLFSSFTHDNSKNIDQESK